MKQFWITFFGSIVGVIIGSVLTVILAIFLIAGMIGSAVQSAEAPRDSLPSDNIVLEVDLRQTRLDQPTRSPFAFTNPLSTTELVAALERAETDERVKGVFVRANEFGMSPAQAEELRRAFESIEAAGKFVIAHAQGFEGTGVVNYFAVAGASELWLQDTAGFSATGLSTETPFLGGLFEQFGVEPQFVQFHEYKNAANVYTETDYTEAHREATLSYLGSIFDTAIESAASDRGIDTDRMETIIVSGPYSAEQAQQAGLVDTLGHVETARQAALEQAGGSEATVGIEDYFRSAPPQMPGANRALIALVSGQGAIVTGEGTAGFGGDELIGSDHLARAIDSAVDDERVRAIVLRVDSPGGSAIASDQIWHSVVRAREAGKPVVVSMGSLAASGGYYIAAPANLIYANATTITGSIGMLSGKFVIDDALSRVGVNIEPLYVGGDYTLAFSSQTEWTESQREAFYRLAEDVYEDFTEKVAEGRDLPLSRIQDVARGRVWTGEQALDLGLVDRIGGLRDAISAARELGGIGEDERYEVRHFPAKPSPFEAFRELFGITAEGAQATARINALLDLPEVRAMIRAREESQTRGLRLVTPEQAPQ